MTKNEAQGLARRIEAFWLARGCHVNVVAVRMEYDPRLRAVRYELRSDLVNGLPVTGTAPLARAA